ncbi:hypothetical protein [Aureimonas pseudogalii]|uniref:Uncharacterized protein n=1 Tax=Aureimonas pseudogalii TaxID=1744844 RepID=A0A7W6H3H7_9HYPH|nr:hypothetical protein [Aureimonas pseudogalii]MBB3996903.1 hypothetical protein [Aureimonas pseudogalii]
MRAYFAAFAELAAIALFIAGMGAAGLAIASNDRTPVAFAEVQ